MNFTIVDISLPLSSKKLVLFAIIQEASDKEKVKLNLLAFGISGYSHVATDITKEAKTPLSGKEKCVPEQKCIVLMYMTRELK